MSVDGYVVVIQLVVIPLLPSPSVSYNHQQLFRSMSTLRHIPATNSDRLDVNGVDERPLGMSSARFHHNTSSLLNLPPAVVPPKKKR